MSALLDGGASCKTDDKKVVGVSILSTGDCLFILAGSDEAIVEAEVLPRAYANKGGGIPIYSRQPYK